MFIEDLLGVIFSFWTALAILIIIVVKSSVKFVPQNRAYVVERFGKYNRINQNGPKEMGWRATSQRLNLNRDYLKADAPEMQALITLYQEWIPDFSFALFQA